MTSADHLKALRRHRWAVLVLLLLGGTGAGLVSATQTPLYRAGVQLLFSPNYPTADVTRLNDGGNYILQRVVSYARIADSPTVASAVIARLHLPYPPAQLTARITVTTTAGTAVMDVSVVDPRPDRARDIANALGDELSSYLPDLEKPTGAVDSPVKVSIVRTATLPSSPDSPHTATNIGLGLLAGFALGAATASVRYARDPTVREADRFAVLAGVPLLGVVPDDPTDDDLRRLRTEVLLRVVGQRLTSIAVGAPAAGEGKSIVALRLATAFARAGETVVLVDTDVRDPAVDRLLGRPGAVGLTTVLRGEVPLTDATYQWRPDLPLYLLPAGPLPDEPVEQLIRSPELAGVLEMLRLGSALAVIDTPPLLSDAETLSVMARCDATVLVGRVGVTRADGFTAMVEAVRAKGIVPLGVVAAR